MDTLNMYWYTITPPEANSWRSITYGKGIFVAVSSDGTNRVMTSPDGVNWTSVNVPARLWCTVCYGDGKFVAIAADKYLMVSENGQTWVEIPLTTSNAFSRMCYNPDEKKFVALTTSGATLIIDSQSLGYTEYASTVTQGINDSWHDIAYGNGKYVAVSYGGYPSFAMTSPDGVNWTIATNNDYFQYITNTYFIPKRIIFANGIFAIACDIGIMTSVDGIIWAQHYIDEHDNWHGICCNKAENKFVATATNTVTNPIIVSSDNCETWSYGIYDEGTTARMWISVCYGAGMYVAVSEDGYVMAYGTYAYDANNDPEDPDSGSSGGDGSGNDFVFWNVEISQSLEDYRNKQFVKGNWDYYYGDVVVNYMENVDGIQARQISEGGSGVYGAIYVDNSEDTNIKEMTAETGTTSTSVKITGHGLKYADMIMNLTHHRKARVSAVIDANTFLVDPDISSQTAGDIIATYPDANAVCRNNLNKYGLVIPKEISFETTALDFKAGTKLTVNLQAFGMTTNEYYLIESVTLRDEDGKNLIASISSTQRDQTEFNTQQSDTWVDTFAGLNGDASSKQIVEMTNSQAGALTYFSPGKYVDKKDDTLPVVAELDGAATLSDVINRLNSLIQTLKTRQYLGDGTTPTGLKRVDIYKYS